MTRLHAALPGLLVFLVTGAVFAPTIGYDFVPAWDDGGMLLFNGQITSWSWLFMVGSIYFGHWMPLTWFTWTVDAHLWGLWAGGWHAVNVLLHASSAVLLYFIAKRLIGSTWGAVFAALVFAVHPLRMESVAWISERKDVLMGVFFLGAALLWLQGRRWWAFAAFVASCLSKSPGVLLPAMLLALEWYRHHDCCNGRLPTRLLSRLAPFVAVSAAVSAIAFYAVHVGVANLLPWWKIGLGPRLLHVAYSNVYYAWHTLWPSRLSHMIEYTWVPTWDQPEYPIAVALFVGSAILLILTRRRWPALAAAGAGYAVAVLPQSGLFQNGPQLVANRYSYLACLPLALLVGGAVTMGMRRWPRAIGGLSVATILALIVTTELNLPMWRNGETLWTYSAEAEPTCTMCQDWAGVFAYTHGDLRATRRYFERAIPVSNTTPFPRYERYWGLGKVLEELGEPHEATVALHAYLATIPDDYRTHDQAYVKDAEARLARLEATPARKEN